MYIRTLEGLGQHLSPDQLKHGRTALAEAFKVIRHKVLKPLEEIALRGRLPARGSRADCALMANFNLAQSDPDYRTRVGEILRTFGRIHALHGRTIDISPVLGPDCGVFKAYVDAATGTIHLCAGFFSLDRNERMATVIHELLHAYTAVRDVAEYEAGPHRQGCTVGAKWTGRSPSDLILNGQSYEHFVLNLIEGAQPRRKDIAAMTGS